MITCIQLQFSTHHTCLLSHLILIMIEYVLLQAIVGVAGGATRAALVQHQARRDNMADVSAKDGSQVSVCVCLCLCTNV